MWMEDWLLDRSGEGCWLKHEELGARLNLTANAVQIHRSWLWKRGLYQRLKRPGARSPGWRPILPAHCRIRSQRPTPDEVAQARTFLDLHLQKGPTLPEEGLDEPRTRAMEGLAGPLNRVLEGLPPAPSTAFDSQPLTKSSTAFDFGVKGNRGLSGNQAKGSRDGDLPQSVLPSNSRPDSVSGEPRNETRAPRRKRTSDEALAIDSALKLAKKRYDAGTTTAEQYTLERRRILGL